MKDSGYRILGVDCRKYTVQFVWSLYAISWAIVVRPPEVAPGIASRLGQEKGP